MTMFEIKIAARLAILAANSALRAAQRTDDVRENAPSVEVIEYSANQALYASERALNAAQIAYEAAMSIPYANDQPELYQLHLNTLLAYDRAGAAAYTASTAYRTAMQALASRTLPTPA